jgi:hypothetical protein
VCLNGSSHIPFFLFSDPSESQNAISLDFIVETLWFFSKGPEYSNANFKEQPQEISFLRQSSQRFFSIYHTFPDPSAHLIFIKYSSQYLFHNALSINLPDKLVQQHQLVTNPLGIKQHPT